MPNFGIRAPKSTLRGPNGVHTYLNTPYHAAHSTAARGDREYLDGLRLLLSGGAFGAGLKRLRAALEQGGEAFLIQHPQAQGLSLIQL